MSSKKAKENNRAPLISVVMPAYNREGMIGKAIESVLAQQFADWELLVVDDGSEDATKEVIAGFAEKDSRVRLLVSEHKGVSGARNVALESARGQVFAYLDSDNTWRPEYLSLLAGQLLGRIRASCYGGLQLHILDDEGKLQDQKVLLNDYDRRIILKRNQIDLNAFAHTADLYWLCGGFDESMTRLVDWDFILRLCRDKPPEKLDVVIGDYFHHRGKDRVSVQADYKLNRMIIALKHMLGEGAEVHLFGPELTDAERESWAQRGLPYRWHDKEEVLSSWRPDPEDVVIWEWTPWDEKGGNLPLLGRKIDLDCGLSFYHVPRHASVDAILAPGFYRKFHFVVLEDPKFKAEFEKKLDERRTVKDINPIDTLLVRRRPRNKSESFSHYLDLLVQYDYPKQKPSICIGIQALSTENLMEWGDYHFALSLGKALEAKGSPFKVSCRDQWDDEVPKHDVFLHLFGINHPELPPKGDQFRCIWIISHPDRVRMDEVAKFDMVFVASEKFAKHLKKTYPGLRVVFMPQATDITAFSPRPQAPQWDLAFVGNSRNVARPAVTYAAKSGKSLAIWGAGWESMVAAKHLQPGFLPSSEVADVYQRAKIVLNDHWEDQKRWGFVNNRIFDVLACNRIPLSDEHEELSSLIPEVPTFRNRKEFDKQVRRLLSGKGQTQASWPRHRVCERHTFHHRAHTLLSEWGRMMRVVHPDGVAPYKRPRILYIHGAPSANTTRKRCFEISAALDGLFPVRRIPFEKADIDQMLGSDIVIFQRWTHQYPDRITHIFDCISSLREQGKAFVYEIDDYIFHFGEGLPKQFMKACDAVFVSTEHLKQLASVYNPNVHLLPNAVDAERFNKITPLYLSRRKKHVLLASTDAVGVDRVLQLADRLRVELPNIMFHFVSSQTRLPRVPNVTFHPMMDYDRLVAFYKACDLVLNFGQVSEHLVKKLEEDGEDLNLDDFINAKSELKFQEAGLAGKPLVTESKPVVYKGIVKHKKNGWIADSEDEQVEAIRWLLLNPKARHQMGAQAKEDVLFGHTLAARWPLYSQAIIKVNEARRLRADIWFYDPEHWLGAQAPEAGEQQPRFEDLQQIQSLRRTLEGFKRRGRSKRVYGGSGARIMNSLRWRLSSELVESFRSPKRAIMFPIRVARVYFDWRKKKQED